MSCLSLSFQCITVHIAIPIGELEGFWLKMFVGGLLPYALLFGFVLNFLGAII